MAKVELDLSARGVEVTNFILSAAIDQIRKSPTIQKDMLLSETDIKKAEAVRNKLKDLLLKRKL